MIVGGIDGVLTALDVESGDIQWQYRTAASIGSSPAEYEDSVVFTSTDVVNLAPYGRLEKLDLNRGDCTIEGNRESSGRQQ